MRGGRLSNKNSHTSHTPTHSRIIAIFPPAIRKPFTPPSLSLASDPILCLETTRSFTYDFTKPPQESHQREVVLRFRVSDVVFPTTETKTSTTTSTTNSNIKDLQLLRRHKFLLLAGGAHQEFYDPHTDVVTWRKNGEADGMDELDNKIYLVEAFHKVLNETMVRRIKYF